MHTPSSPCGPKGPDSERWVGDPVDVVTGAQTDSTVDFRLHHAAYDVVFHRHYDSRFHADDRGLGPGFRHGFDHRLRFDVDGLRYEGPDFTEVGFPFLLQVGDAASAPGWVLTRVADASYVLRASDLSHTLQFEMGRDGHARLDSLTTGRHALHFQYARDGRLSGLGASTGYSVRFEWSGPHLQQAVWINPQDQRQRTLIRYTYDAEGRLVQGTDGYGHSFGFEYDARHRVARRTDRNGYSFEFQYDADGRCVLSRGEDGVLQVALAYDSQARLTKVTRADGGEWLYFYDDMQMLLQVIDPYGGTTVYGRDPLTGQISEKIDPAGNKTRYVYDATGKLSALVSPSGETYAPGEDPPKPRHRVGANALEWELGLDAPKDFTLPDRTEGLRFVSPAVRQAVVTASVPGVGRFEPVRDAYGTLVREQRADGANRRFAYDANGNVRTFVDADGRVFRSEYSSWNHRVREISPLGHVEQHAYDAHESRTALVDPGGTRSEYVYDEKDRLVEVHRHGQLRERYLYDDADRLVEKQDRDRATLVKWTFGTGPLKATRELASGEKQSFAYDEHGRLIAGAGAAGELNFAYQASGRRVRDLRDGKGVEHHGPLLDVHVLGRFVTRTRKVDATTTVLVDPTGNIHRLMTDAHGLQHRELAHGVTETTQYHPDGMPLMRALERPHSDTPLWVRRYHYDAEGNLTRAVDTERGLREFGYDAAGRLEREVSPDGSVAPYAYDEAGNLLQMPGLSEHGRQGSAAASPGHECIARGAGNRIYRANGQLFQYDLRDHVAVRVAADGSPVRYTYDSFDHLVGIEAPGLSFSAKYDVLGRRTERTVNGERCLYYWDTDRLAAECFPDGRLRVYVYAGDRSLVPLMFVDYGSEDAPTDSGQVYYVFANHLGCPELITDAHGAAVWRAHIAPYGNATLELGHDFHQPLRWPGHFYDAETGLHYNRFRYYDPSLGRYLQSDPAGIAGGSNLYAYTDNPLRQVDVRGLGCPNKKRKVDEGEGEPEQESADAAIRRRHGEEWGVDAETGKLDPNARFQGKTHAEVDALARKPARDGEPDIVRRRRRYLEEKRKENKEPRPMNQWAEDGYRVNANRDRSSPHEEGALSAVGAKPNNAAAGEGGQNTHEHTEWHDKNGRALPPNPDGTPPKGATGQRTTTTRPDGTRGNDVVEHKHLTGEDGTLHDSQQLRAQREMARQRGGEHELVMSSDKPPLANGDPPVQPSSGAADGSNVKYYDTTRDPPQVTHQWDKGRWKPV